MNKKPETMVYLKEIEPTIIESIRYATSENFTARPILGYEKPKAIITREAAFALREVQKSLLQDGFSLVVYDAYRPQKSVDFFVKWMQDKYDQSAKEKYFPRVNKADLIRLNYMSDKSGHSRGSSIDVSLVSLTKKIENVLNIKIIKRQMKDGSVINYLDDNSLDMGSSFDLFDTASHHDSPIVDSQYIISRNYLKEKMVKNGFKAWQEEWWHYTLENEPYPDTYFDFDVV